MGQLAQLLGAAVNVVEMTRKDNGGLMGLSRIEGSSHFRRVVETRTDDRCRARQNQWNIGASVEVTEANRRERGNEHVFISRRR